MGVAEAAVGSAAMTLRSPAVRLFAALGQDEPVACGPCASSQPQLCQPFGFSPTPGLTCTGRG